MAARRSESGERDTVLVLGVTGGYGGTMAAELLRAGYRLLALVRDRARGEAVCAGLPGEVALFEGDVLDREALARAADGVGVIVHGVNAPYPDWDPLILEHARAVAEVAARQGATVLFPGNVYGYAPARDVDEDAAPTPPTRKGELRVEVEAILAQACERGARLIVLRGGDFFGAGHGASWMKMILGRAATGGPIVLPGPKDVPHAWCYLPDFCATHRALLERSAQLPAVSRFHFRGHTLTGAELLEAAREALGDPRRASRTLPWWLFRLGAPFSPMLRSLLEMRYLWQEELTLSDARLRATLGDALPQTDLPTGLRAELERLRECAA